MILNYTKTFIDKINNLSRAKTPYQIFGDFIDMSAAALYSWKKDEKAEQEYLDKAKGYSGEELEKMAELLFILTDAFEKTDQRQKNYEDNYIDFLGKIFMSLNFGNKGSGQFFTPYNISHMMAEMMFGERGFPLNRVLKICDPCCGGGGMLIACSQVLKNREINFQKDVLYIGKDIDERCAKMTFIQLSLLGVPAVISCGNSLTGEVHWQRETIGYHLSGMDYRLRTEEMLDYLEKSEKAEPGAYPEPEDPAVITLPPSREYVQGELF